MDSPNLQVDSDVKVVYLNINGLLQSDHKLDLDSDINMKSADIICIAETKIDETVPEQQILLSGFTTVYRLDHRHNSMGMVVYKKNQSRATFTVQAASTRADDSLQTVQCHIGHLPFCFSYIHPEHKRRGLHALKDIYRPNEIVMGDLNINSADDDNRALLQEACDDMDVMCTDLGPTRLANQIDHILLPTNLSERGIRVVVQKYTNLYSDHASVALRFCDYHLDSDTDMMSDSD